jgi:hypothetical protein
MNRLKFWMVLGADTPVYRHSSKSAAIAEAERLARMIPMQEFTVLESLAVCRKSDIAWEQTTEHLPDNEPVPF